MSITKLTDSEVRQRIHAVTEWAEIERAVYDINTTSHFNAATMAHEQGIRIHVINRSGQAVIDVICALPDEHDSMFEVAAKRRALRIAKTDMQKLIRSNLGNAS